MIRSLTVGLPIFTSSISELEQELRDFQKKSTSLLEQQHLEARTVRLALPISSHNEEEQPGTLRSIFESVRSLASVAGARWYCFPVDLFREAGREALLAELQTLILRDNKLFANLIVARPDAISLQGASLSAGFIQALSRRSPTGIDNFRVGISAACPANAPFFPFSRHEGENTAFSIAMETTAVVLQTAHRARAQKLPLSVFHSELRHALGVVIKKVDEFGRQLEATTSFAYRGLDASLAPFPDGETSVGKVIELLGPTPVGAPGTLFMTSVLTDAVKSALNDSEARSIGFNGVMYSVMEDDALAQANNMRALSIEKLAAFSTVCACGIDMVPLPSNMFAEDVAHLILDIAALAVRLEKPLGVRLLPVPRAAVNEYTQMNLDFICDSRVMDTGVSGSRPLLAGKVFSYGQKRERDLL